MHALWLHIAIFTVYCTDRSDTRWAAQHDVCLIRQFAAECAIHSGAGLQPQVQLLHMLAAVAHSIAQHSNSCQEKVQP